MSDNHNEAPENCTHDCSTCGEACAQHEPESLQQPLRPGSRVDKVIAVVSGKGGVGKSLVTSLLACEMQRRGHQAAVLDADITGPSIPQAFGVHGGAMGGEDFLYANRTRTGIEIMSINLLLPNETDPVVWPGHRRRRDPVLDRRAVGQRELYVRRHASRNGRCAADGVPVPARGGRGRRHVPAGARRHDRRQGRQHGRHDARARARHRREHGLLHLPGLRQAARHLR